MDATKPTDVELISALPAYIRETRAAVNSISCTGNVGVTDLTVPVGATSLSIGAELGTYGYEVVVIRAVGVVNISMIVGGTQGQVKTFIFQDGNISMIDGPALNGALYLNQLPVFLPFAAQAGDVLTLVNIGGNGSTIQGYWKEISRQIAVK